MSKFTYSKVIRPKKTDSFIYDATLKNRLNKFRGHTLDKPIHLYRMWFHLVRLVVDCEKNKITFGGKNEHKVKLNKRFYKDWEIEKYLTASFDDWFQDKIEIFAEREVEKVNEGKKSSDHFYLKVHKSQRKEDAIRQIRNLLEDGMFQSGSKFPITGKHKYINLHQQYNAFILRQNAEMSGLQIGQWMGKEYSKYSKNVSGAKTAKTLGGKTEVNEINYTSMRRVYRASEELVLEVSKGIF
ncbi:hypothetical protein N8466_00585 [Gammaproteobacteria bacterium]|jgi:hypothetical protein|nr:hypothetical protein [Gammaproteobacteria bacterium]MDC1535230.1 hypothetical protein [Gammaproteobacteria bacterium]|tara:strand:+ start:732 stop:1454 length:723 start_codon:yes stop_codon:yes gene_type:complete